MSRYLYVVYIYFVFIYSNNQTLLDIFIIEINRITFFFLKNLKLNTKLNEFELEQAVRAVGIIWPLNATKEHCKSLSMYIVETKRSVLSDTHFANELMSGNSRLITSMK